MKESGKKSDEMQIESVEPVCLTYSDAAGQIAQTMQEILKILDGDLG